MRQSRLLLIDERKCLLQSLRRVEWLSPYGPDLAPVENVWNQSKCGARANVIPEDIPDLHSALDHVLETFRHEPNRLHTALDAAHLIL